MSNGTLLNILSDLVTRDLNKFNKSCLNWDNRSEMHVTRAYTPAAFILDLQKAFDTNNQNILLAKLNHYGIKGTSFNWFQPFICDTVQYTSIDLKESFLLFLLLFIVFINDLNISVKNSKVHHHADDAKLLLTEKPLKKINK